jgi:hypothetical protein
MTTTTPHTLSQLADIGAAAAHKAIHETDSWMPIHSGSDAYPETAHAREAFAKAVLDAVGYKFPVDPEREAFDAWVKDATALEGVNCMFEAWKAGREELRKAQTLDKEPAASPAKDYVFYYQNDRDIKAGVPWEMGRPENDGWIDWLGGDCPVDRDVTVQVQYRAEDFGDTGNAGGFRWNLTGKASDIVAYKIVKP